MRFAVPHISNLHLDRLKMCAPKFTVPAVSLPKISPQITARCVKGLCATGMCVSKVYAAEPSLPEPSPTSDFGAGLNTLVVPVEEARPLDHYRFSGNLALWRTESASSGPQRAEWEEITATTQSGYQERQPIFKNNNSVTNNLLKPWRELLREGDARGFSHYEVRVSAEYSREGSSNGVLNAEMVDKLIARMAQREKFCVMNLSKRAVEAAFARFQRGTDEAERLNRGSGLMDPRLGEFRVKDGVAGLDLIILDLERSRAFKDSYIPLEIATFIHSGMEVFNRIENIKVFNIVIDVAGFKSEDFLRRLEDRFDSNLSPSLSNQGARRSTYEFNGWEPNSGFRTRPVIGFSSIGTCVTKLDPSYLKTKVGLEVLTPKNLGGIHIELGARVSPFGAESPKKEGFAVYSQIGRHF